MLELTVALTMLGQPLPADVCSSVLRALLLAQYITTGEATAQLEAMQDSDGSDSDTSDSGGMDDGDDMAYMYSDDDDFSDWRQWGW